MNSEINHFELDPEDFGEKTAYLEMDHEEAIEYVRDVCEKNGFGIIAEFSPSKVLNKKVDSDHDPYYVLGACNAKFADKALKQTMKIGGLFPCNMVIWEEKPGLQKVYHLSIMKLARLLDIAPNNEEWQEILEETGKNVESVFEELKSD